MLGKILGLGGSKRNLIPICNDMVGAMLEAQSFLSFERAEGEKARVVLCILSVPPVHHTLFVLRGWRVWIILRGCAL